MPFKKGQSGNTDGRPVGSKNKRSLQWEALGEFITQEGAEIFMDNLVSMMGADDKKERLSGMDMYMKTLEYFKPRLNRSEVKHEGTPEIKITYEEKPY